MFLTIIAFNVKFNFRIYTDVLKKKKKKKKNQE